MSTAWRLFLNRGRTSTRRRRKISPEINRKKTEHGLQRSGDGIACAGDQPIGQPGSLHLYRYRLLGACQVLGSRNELLERCYRLAEKAEPFLQFWYAFGQL